MTLKAMPGCSTIRNLSESVIRSRYTAMERDWMIESRIVP